MDVPPGLDVGALSQIINLMKRIPKTEESLKLTGLLVSMYINQVNENHESPKTTRKRPSSQIDNDRKVKKEAAKKPKKDQFNKTENSKDKSTLIEYLLVFEERKCYICEEVFDKTSTFVNHLKGHNSLCGMVELVEEGQSISIIQCALCEKRFKSTRFAASHVNASHKAIKEICDSDAFIPKKQTPIETNNPPPIAESSNTTAIQPTGQTLVTNNQNGGVVMGSSWGFCFGCRMKFPFIDYKAHMASNNNKNVPVKGERSTNTHTAAHRNYQGNVKEEVSIQRNVQEAANTTKQIWYNEMVRRALKEFLRQETVEEDVDKVIDLTDSDDEDAKSQLNNTPSSSTYRQD